MRFLTCISCRVQIFCHKCKDSNFCFLQYPNEMALRIKIRYLKLNVTTENCYLTAVGARTRGCVCVCVCVGVHTRTNTFMTAHHTWHYSIYTSSSAQYSIRNNVSNSGPLFTLRYENGEAPAELGVTEEANHNHCTSYICTSTYIRTYNHNTWWYRFDYLTQTKLDRMCTRTGSFTASWLRPCSDLISSKQRVITWQLSDTASCQLTYCSM